MQAAKGGDGEGFVMYTPSAQSGKLVGSEFTSFFLASVVDPDLNGMRLAKVGFLLWHT